MVTPILNAKEIICDLPRHLGTCQPSHVGSTALEGHSGRGWPPGPLTCCQLASVGFWLHGVCRCLATAGFSFLMHRIKMIRISPKSLLLFVKLIIRKKILPTAQCHVTITVNPVGLSADAKVSSPAPLAMKWHGLGVLLTHKAHGSWALLSSNGNVPLYH